MNERKLHWALTNFRVSESGDNFFFTFVFHYSTPVMHRDKAMKSIYKT